ncbi:MAG: AI-2E family transporter [Lachnospiraceae bacterium]|nr:AI-2E family transporter [Lachnospiraceae bacterium]
MKLHLNNRYVRWGLTFFCVVVASILFYYFMFHGANITAALKKIINILMPIVYGFVMAYVLTPAMNQIEYRFMKPLSHKISFKTEKKRKAFTRAVSVLVTMVLFCLVIYAVISMFISQIVPSVSNLVSNYDTYIENATNVINKLLEDNPDIGNYLIRLVNQYSGNFETWLNEKVLSLSTGGEILKKISLGVINVIGVIFDLVVGLIISIYLLAGKEKFIGQAKKITYAVFSRETANSIIRTCRFTHKTFIGFLSGKVLDSVLIGLLCFIGTTILRTPYAALVSVIIGVTNIIPFFGPAIGAVPTAILIFLVDPIHPQNMLYFIIFIIILQQFDGNILGPKILGESTGLSGFWVIFAITLFGGAFGVIGMIIGVPIFAVVYAWIKQAVKISLEKKKMPLETDKYMALEMVDENGITEFVPEYQKKIDSQKLAKEQAKAQAKNQFKNKGKNDQTKK